MGDEISLNIKGLDEIKRKLSSFEKNLAKNVDEALNTNIKDIEFAAINNAFESAFDEGNLARSIHADDTKFLEKRITVNAVYAAFVEFGTGKYAAQYVSTLPDNWQAFAAQYRGQKGGGTMDEFLMAMVEWVKRKGLHGITKSGRAKTGKKADADAYNIAYVILIRILQNGIHAHPFLYPAFRNQEVTILKNVEDILNGL